MPEQRIAWKKKMKLIGNAFFALLLALLVVLVFFIVTSKTSQDGVPRIGNYSLMVVLSGSMSPTFKAGDVIVVSTEQQARYGKGDIITFRDPGDTKRIVTHRVIEVIGKEKGVSYRTKGDANETPDPQLIPAANVIGRERWHIPYLGWLTEFAKTKQGFIGLVIVPGILIIASELRNIAKAITDEVEKKKQEA